MQSSRLYYLTYHMKGRLMKVLLIAAAVLLSLVIISCEQPPATPTPAPTPTSTPVATATATQPIATPTTAPTPTAQPTPIPPTATPPLPTPTPAATATPVPTPTLAATATPTPAPSPTPTPLPTAPLSLKITAPAPDSTITTASVTVKGTTRIDAVVSVNAILADVDQDGNFAVVVVLDPGPNVLEIIASDFEGNQVSEVLAVVYLAQK